MNFGLIGAAGYIAPRHIKAIHETGHQLAVAADPHDCVGHLDQHFPETRFFTEIERFDRFLEKRRRGPEEQRIHYISVCSPNYLHDAHVRLALRTQAHAICEKPLVISPWNLDALEELEADSQGRIFTVLQLRLLPALQKLRQEITAENSSGGKRDVALSYVTRRGRWYHTSWKGTMEKSGGVAMNIGIHFFDLLQWCFGAAEFSEVHLRAPDKMAGYLELERARVRWLLSTDVEDLPPQRREQGHHAFRSMTVDGQDLEFSHGFTDLHTEVYRRILQGEGTGVQDARPSIELVYDINQSETVSAGARRHPQLDQVTVRDPKHYWRVG